jgi:uncharacterized MnhB-related membrane protein
VLAQQTLIAQNIFFGIIAALMIFGAIRVVTSKNVVHAALWLVCVLAGAAAQYLLVYAEFVAVTQVLVYVGAVMVLFLFGVMLTRAKLGREGDLNNKNWALGIPVAVVLFGAMSVALATPSSGRTCCRSGRCPSFCSSPSSARSSWPGRISSADQRVPPPRCGAVLHRCVRRHRA